MNPRLLRIKITRSGWLFVFLSLGVGASALNTGNNLLYLLFGTMLSFLILSGLLSNNTLQHLAIHPYFPSRIFVDQPVSVRLELENRKRLFPSFALSLAPRGNESEKIDSAFIIKLPAGASTRTENHIRFRKRGKSKLPTYAVETAYPFGLIKKNLAVSSEGETIVYPKLVDLDPWLAEQRNWMGEFLSGERGGTTHPYGIRDLIEGDPARLIHWKSSAKQQKWKVKEFESEKRLRVTVEVVLAPKDQSQPKWRELAISSATTLIVLLFSRGIEITLDLNSETIEPEGRGYLDAYLTALALANPPRISPPRRNVRPGETVAVVSDLPSIHADGNFAIGREELERL